MCQIFAGQDPDRYETVTRRLRLNGQSTSIRLERAFWWILDDIAARQGVTTPAFISKLHAEVLELHGEARNFTSLLRCACLIEARRPDAARARLWARRSPSARVPAPPRRRSDAPRRRCRLWPGCRRPDRAAAWCPTAW